MLEQEFRQYAHSHKVVMLKAKILDYYQTLEQGQVNLPSFMRDDTPEIKTEKEIHRLLNLGDNLEQFNKLYELAYQELAPMLP